MEPVSGCLIRKTCMSSPFEVYLKEQNKHFQSSGSVSFSYKQADTNPAAGLMLFHTFDGDSWEIQETFFRQYKQVCHPGGAGLPVQKECASGTVSCCQYWQEWYWKITAKYFSQGFNLSWRTLFWKTSTYASSTQGQPWTHTRHLCFSAAFMFKLIRFNKFH